MNTLQLGLIQGNLRCFGANCNMSRTTRFVCYIFLLKYSSVLYFTLFPSLLGAMQLTWVEYNFVQFITYGIKALWTKWLLLALSRMQLTCVQYSFVQCVTAVSHRSNQSGRLHYLVMHRNSTAALHCNIWKIWFDCVFVFSVVHFCS